MAHIPPSLSHLLMQLRISKTGAPDGSPSLSAFIGMDAGEQKAAIQELGLKKTTHRSKLKKRLEQLVKTMDARPEDAFKFYNQAYEDSKGTDYSAMLKLVGMYSSGLGCEKNEQKAYELEVEAKSLPAYKQVVVKRIKEASKAEGENRISWGIEIVFFNEKHEKVHTTEVDTAALGSISETVCVREYLDVFMMPELKKLKWNECHVWCGHEKVKPTTQFLDLAYQVTKGKLTLSCLNNEGKPTTSSAKMESYPECIVCFEENDGKQYLACRHACLCKRCFEALDKCPICNKRKSN
eukprot:CAMPEP_0114516798 /NCGR_PEP_ID=MMETSP0109-20121206/17529_1 /TAXON_ID=29199 /ORGANISM="Chlorarachnion reptans, Strain CCCM449" /LENGTH=294 /DNA_ID=CAMNT_0001697229 /DNA_START=75 /DNA_END=959 /DNA_ORIENTATION=-